MAVTRGTVLELTPAAVVERALSAVGLEIDGRPIRYRLGWGGTNPALVHPAHRRRESGRVVWGCDCSGLVAWCLGMDRKQPATEVGWVETSRMIRDAEGPQDMFEPVDAPELGAVVVYGDHDGRQGHTGVIVGLGLLAEWADVAECWAQLRIVDCSSGRSRRTGHAIGARAGSLWGRRGGRILRRAI